MHRHRLNIARTDQCGLFVHVVGSLVCSRNESLRAFSGLPTAFTGVALNFFSSIKGSGLQYSFGYKDVNALPTLCKVQTVRSTSNARMFRADKLGNRPVEPIVDLWYGLST